MIKSGDYDLTVTVVGWDGGVVVRYGKKRVIFDPTKPSFGRIPVFITHAHADHTGGFASRGLKHSTRPTREIYEALNRRLVTGFHDLETGKTITYDDIEITPINAGHMLGSVQYRVTTPDSTILFTGDLNCVDTLTTEAAEDCQCDDLIIEGTYGQPFYVFPPRDTTYARIVEWSVSQIRDGKKPLFQVFAAGKAQELIRLFNLYTKLKVIVHPRVAMASQAYVSGGCRLDFSEADSLETSSSSRTSDAVYITTARLRMQGSGFVKASATGWALSRRFSSHPAFPLSSHADFRQLVRFVKTTKAKRVHVYVGFKHELASFLEKSYGINARPIQPVAQKDLKQYQ